MSYLTEEQTELNSALFKVNTIKEKKVLNYINSRFTDFSLKLELMESGREIKATDANKEAIVFYYDDETDTVKTHSTRRRLTK